MMLSASSLQTNAGLRMLVKAAARVIMQVCTCRTSMRPNHHTNPPSTQEVRSAEDAQREAALKRSAKAARMRRDLHKHESTAPLPSSSQQHQQPKPHPSSTFVVPASAPATAAELERRKQQRVAEIMRLRERRAAAADEDAARSTVRAAERKGRTRLAHDCAGTLAELVRLEEEAAAAAAAAAAAEAAAAASDESVSEEETDIECVSTASEASAGQAPCSVAQLLPSLDAAPSSSSPAHESLAASPAARDARNSAPLRPVRDNEIGTAAVASVAAASPPPAPPAPPSLSDRSVDSREARALDFLAQHAVKTQQQLQQQQHHAAPAGSFAPLTPVVLHQPHQQHLGVASPSKSALSSTRAKPQHGSPQPLHDAAPFTLDDMMNDFTFSSMVWSGTASSVASRSPAAVRPVAAATVSDAAAGRRQGEGGAVHGAKTVPGHHRQKQPQPQQKLSARGYTLPPLARTGPWEGGPPRQAPGDERRERLGLVRDAKRHRMFEENSLIGRHAQREDAGADALRDDRAFDATPARPVPAWRLRTLRRCI